MMQSHQLGGAKGTAAEMSGLRGHSPHHRGAAGCAAWPRPVSGCPHSLVGSAYPRSRPATLPHFRFRLEGASCVARPGQRISRTRRAIFFPLNRKPGSVTASGFMVGFSFLRRGAP
jgi:hypothetical protein